MLRQDVRDVKLRGAARDAALRGDLLVREIVEEVVQEEEFFFRVPFHVMDRLLGAGTEGAD
jgi:hypothetical protein